MGFELLEQIRLGLLERRSWLSGWLNTAPSTERDLRLGPAKVQDLYHHLDTIEKSIEKAEKQELGRCIVCHDYVDTSLLEMDYTAEVCISHLSSHEISSLETELELAQTVQKSLLPQQPPASEYLEIAAFSRPAQVIGGDYFDFFEFQDGSPGIAIADVAGHGISAALHMASIQALLRTLVPSSDSPVEVVKHIQKLLIHNIRFSNFVTIFLASYDPRRHILQYCNAGHNPPIWLSRNGSRSTTIDWLKPTGAAVGLIEELILEGQAVQLQPGDTIVLYTDGITEAMNPSGDPFGWERLAEIVAHQATDSPAEMLQTIRQELAAFVSGQTLEDDTTLLICRIVR